MLQPTAQKEAIRMDDSRTERGRPRHRSVAPQTRFSGMSPSPLRSPYFSNLPSALAVLAVWIAAGIGSIAAPVGTVTTLYVNRYFEVRDHDAPTKFVFNRSTRVARVT